MNLTALYENGLFEETDEKEILESMVSLPTEDDLPYDDGVPMETGRHRDQMILLIESLKAFWGEDKRYFVSGNMFLHFDLLSKKKFRGPDFFLVLDVDNRERKSWVVWQEQMKFPDLIIELLSDSTRTTDKTEKKDLYEQVFRTPEYYVYDPFSFEFSAYRLIGRKYKQIVPDKEKKIYSMAAGLYLIVKNEKLRWMTKENYICPTHAELFERELQISKKERLRAEIEKQRADEMQRVVEEYRRRFGEL